MKNIFVSRRIFLGLLLALSNPSSDAQIKQDAWVRAQDRAQQRIEHQAVTLQDGRILVAGGYDVEALDILFGNGTGQRLDSVEIYDPKTDSWSAAAHMPRSAGFQWAALLKTGDVLFWGNFNPNNGAAGTFSAVYDPRRDTWTLTAPLPIALANDHAFMRAVALPDGRVLSVGGGTSIGPSDAALIFTPDAANPSKGTWDFTRSTRTGTITRPHRGRASGALAALKDGRVLFVGGAEGPDFGDLQSSNAADLFDPVTGEWIILADMPAVPGERSGSGDSLDDGNTVNPGARWAPIAETLPDGTVLIACGLQSGFDGVNLFFGRRRSAIVFDPRNLGSPWTIVPHMNRRRWFSRSAVLHDGQGVIVVGGGVDPSTTEIYDFVSHTWTMAASFPSIDAFGSQLNSLSGNLLLTGGFDYDISPPSGIPEFGSVKSFLYIPGLPGRSSAPEAPESLADLRRLVNRERRAP